jgi:hypothetical protein
MGGRRRSGVARPESTPIQSGTWLSAGWQPMTEDLRKIQPELNWQRSKPQRSELMEALNSPSETEPIETLRVALDQMRHFPGSIPRS